MQRLPVERHLTANQARAKYRACRHPVEKTRWHAVWLLLRADEPRTPAQGAEVVGLPVITVRDVLHRWNDHGRAGCPTAARGTGPSPSWPPTGGPSCSPPWGSGRPTAGCGPARRWRPTSATGGAWGCAPDRVGVAAGAGLHPPGPPPGPPRRGRRPDPGPVEKNLRRRVTRLRRANPDRAVEVW